MTLRLDTLETTRFGTTTDGREARIFTLTNPSGLQAKITEYGAILTSLRVPDREGRCGEITVGYGDDFAGWERSSGYFGATVGRFGNRIGAGKFSLDGREYTLATNNDPGNIPCHLHGGLRGFDKVVWEGKAVEKADAVGVELRYRSVDGEEGYPGNLDVVVTYWLTGHDELRFEVEATTDAPTPVNIINHIYWNLTGDPAKVILDHELQLFADKFLPTNAGLIPTGKLAPVTGTPLDFTAPTVIGERIEEKFEALVFAGGYDHCWVVRECAGPGAVRPAAIAYEPISGRVLEVLTDQPGIQFYSGNFMDGDPAPFRTGFCLETECFPDSPNQPGFPGCILQPGETYRHSQIFRFSTR